MRLMRFDAKVLAVGGAALMTVFAPGAMATPDADTKLVACGEASCLLVSGRRDDAASDVSINGHPVAVEGQRAWRVSLPVETIREWSLPRARTIDVTLMDPRTGDQTTSRAGLPIGLLGHVTDFAALVIGTR
ncbi:MULTISPECIES: hypothetical protein [unclassified Novosphingobium]|uniref:hypothetical protein n=1 Tax=unclassified Novosphingobium TaxID=2644732 RepID=UPI001F2E30AA|nr:MULTISPECIES: hypothetical protein [unclassified Novosphingobium]